ncbi:hypothetical protein FKX85_17220 [Echinicola soli]|uniref:Uncharacterized protein n=1 Tax=Echinicola soli TaxID=2591634 RepID=A0A514CLI4_9BACT|nr:hypothetical protein [Echinicola soli]QDH80686.1 hypothetical protein FKX85_17220 [Echinicola soli]
MKKTKLLIFGILILQLNFSCKTQYSTTELNENFTSEQIADLKKITDFFQEQMCLKMESDFKTCYERTPHEYLEATGNGFWTNINFEEQKKLYEQISKSTFDEIWDFCETTYFHPNETKVKEICAVYNGKYQKFLSDLGNSNPAIAEYLKKIQASGDYSYSNIRYWNVLNDKKHFDLNDPNIQLILAIHYLSMNDQESRNNELREKAFENLRKPNRE